MKQIQKWIVDLFKDGPASTHPLAIAAFSLSFFVPGVGFVLGFVARTQIAFSEGRYSGDRLALAAIFIAPLVQFSTLLLGALWLVATLALPESF